MTDDDHTPTDVIDACLAGPQHALERVPTLGAARAVQAGLILLV